MSERTDDVIDRVREVRRKISKAVGHDPEALVRHYQELEKSHPKRMLRGQSGITVDRKDITSVGTGGP